MDNANAGMIFPFRIGNWEFKRTIGSGAYSTAFLVRSLKYGRDFCAKMTQVDETFFDCKGGPKDPELNALLSLDNPNVIRVYDYFRIDNLFFLVLELCESGNLAEKIKETGPVSADVIGVLLSDILNGLVACHEHHIAHRDIKPHNIFLDRYGHAKVADFGLSSYLNPNQLVTTQCGSPFYAAPEIFGNSAYDPFKADVWSLGVTIYQAAVGRVPWSENVDLESRSRPDPEFPSFVHPLLADLIKWMLRVDPAERPTMKQIQWSKFFTYARFGQDEDLRMQVRAWLCPKRNPQPPERKEMKHIPHTRLISSSARRMAGPNQILDRNGRRSSARAPRTYTFDMA